jgi:hypothetical protein
MQEKMNKGVEEEVVIPESLTCPVTKELFKKPVVVFPSGKTYEEWVVLQLLENANKKYEPALCPLTRQKIINHAINYSVKDAVADFLIHNPSLKAAKEEEAAAPQAPAEFKEPQPISPRRNQFTGTGANAPQGFNFLFGGLSRPPIFQYRTLPVSVAEQSAVDEALARRLQEMEISANQEAEREAFLARPSSYSQSYGSTPRPSVRSTPPSVEHRPLPRAPRVEPTAARNVAEDSFHPLNTAIDKERQVLINDLKNLIYALKFEVGPQPRGSIQNDSLVFFAIVEHMLLQPLPWQKIKVAEGPKNDHMYQVLKAAIRALKELNKDLLSASKQSHNGQYDCVQTTLKGNLSIAQHRGYAGFAQSMGTISNQPGLLVHGILQRVELCFKQIEERYPNSLVHEQKSEGTRMGGM